MKYLIIIAALAVTPASQSVAASSAKTCASLSEAAYSIMAARQRGVSPSQLIGGLDQVEMSDDIRELFQSMIDDAMNAPGYLTEEMREGAATSYGAEIYAACRGGGV